MSVTLFCPVVGVGSVFAVDIDLTRTVGHLKKKIKEEMPNLIHFDAALLKLYLAKRGSSWLNIGSNDIKAVQRGETPETIKVLMKKRMVETRKLENRAYLGTRFVTVEDDIHILVELPAEPDQVKSSSTTLPSSYLPSLFVIDKASQIKKDA